MQGRVQFKEQRLGQCLREQGSPVIVFCVQHFLLPQSVQDEIQVPAHRPPAATAASQLPLPEPADGANATAHVPKRIDLGTWNSKQAVKHLPMYLKAAFPEHLEGDRWLICHPEKKKKSNTKGKAAARHNFPVLLRVTCHVQSPKEEGSDAKLIFIHLGCNLQFEHV